jgi:hypothetical protein
MLIAEQNDQWAEAERRYCSGKSLAKIAPEDAGDAPTALLPAIA